MGSRIVGGRIRLREWMVMVLGKVCMGRGIKLI